MGFERKPAVPAPSLFRRQVLEGPFIARAEPSHKADAANTRVRRRWAGIGCLLSWSDLRSSSQALVLESQTRRAGATKSINSLRRPSVTTGLTRDCLDAPADREDRWPTSRSARHRLRSPWCWAAHAPARAAMPSAWCRRAALRPSTSRPRPAPCRNGGANRSAPRASRRELGARSKSRSTFQACCAPNVTRAVLSWSTA